MNNKTKTLTGVSSIAVLFIFIHLLHAAHVVSQLGENKENVFKDAKAIILLKDSSTNKMDTLDLDEYMKKQKQ